MEEIVKVNDELLNILNSPNSIEGFGLWTSNTGIIIWELKNDEIINAYTFWVDFWLKKAV